MEKVSASSEKNENSGDITASTKKGGIGFAIADFFKGMVTNTGIVGEVLLFLWQRKLWWLIPMVTVLLLFGLLLIFASSSGVAPFIYTLF